MIIAEKITQTSRNRKKHEFTLQCDFCNSSYIRVCSPAHALSNRNKKFHFCSLQCTRSSLSAGKYRDAIRQSLALPTFLKTCDCCGALREIKSYDFTPSGYFFCSKKCVYDAQRNGGVTYELRCKNNLETYGVQHSMSREDVKEKRRINVQQKHGVESVFQLEAVKEKMKQTSRERYGVDVYSQTEEFKEKIKETCLEKFGYESPIENPEVLERRRKTMIERYGGPSTWESPVLKKRVEETMLSRYGHALIAQVPSFVSSSMDKKMLKTHGKTWQQYIDDLPEFQDYRRKVDCITRQQPVETLENYDKWGEYHLDHKFSVAEGFRQNVPEEIIGSIVNLEFIPAFENMSKQAKCSIDKDTLLFEYYKEKEDND